MNRVKGSKLMNRVKGSKLMNRVWTITDVFIEGAYTLYQHRIWIGGKDHIDRELTVLEFRKANKPSRIADDLRREIMSVHNLRFVTIAYTCPYDAWLEQDHTIHRKPKGLTSILDHDKTGALEIWYQVTTPEHRATIYIRPQGETTHADRSEVHLFY